LNDTGGSTGVKVEVSQKGIGGGVKDLYRQNIGIFRFGKAPVKPFT
jgi:hypothetical protein